MFNKLDIEKASERFDGHYRGVVVNREDPLKAGRVQVRVFPMFEGVADDDLPWAIPADPFMGGFSNVGGSIIPEVDAHVFVFFENGDFRYPVYFAGAPAITGGTPDIPEEAVDGYPNKKVYRTKEGVVIEIDDTPGDVKVKFSHPSGTKKEIASDGSVTEEVVLDCTVTIGGKYSIEVAGDVEIKATGNATLEATGTASIKAPSIKFN